jgi:hypothetical protein
MQVTDSSDKQNTNKADRFQSKQTCVTDQYEPQGYFQQSTDYLSLPASIRRHSTFKMTKQFSRRIFSAGSMRIIRVG